jgi:hypothetical protein
MLASAVNELGVKQIMGFIFMNLSSYFQGSEGYLHARNTTDKNKY